MKRERQSGATPIGLGFRAGRGGSVVVGVAAEEGEPRVIMSSFLATAAEGDRLSLEPYHLAAEMKRGPSDGVPADAAATVAEGRKRQCQLAAKGLDEIVCRLEEARYEPVIAALLVNRAGWIIDLLAYSLSAPEHPAVAEGLAVREALRFVFRQRGLEVAEMDEKSLQETASKALRKPSTDIDSVLRALGVSAGRPWRKEQQLACLSAWVALAAARSGAQAEPF
jgi:hypothetical protein